MQAGFEPRIFRSRGGCLNHLANETVGEVESLICNFYLKVADAKLSEQICPRDTLACCWDVKQPTNNNNHRLLNVPATCQCISGIDLLGQSYMLPHGDGSCRSKYLPHTDTEPTSHSAYPLTPASWYGSHWITIVKSLVGLTQKKIHAKSGN